MIDRVMNTDTLQDYLVRLIPTRQVRVSEANRVIMIVPIEDKAYRSPLRGIASGSGLTVDKFLQHKRKEKEREREQDIRL